MLDFRHASYRLCVNWGKEAMPSGHQAVQRMICAVSAITTAALISSASAAFGQTAKDLVGSWTLVSAVNTAADGVTTDSFGPNPAGMVIFAADGHFALVNAKGDLPKFATDDRSLGTPEQDKAIVEGSVALFGTYALADKTITFKIQGGTWPGWTGTEQKGTGVSYMGDDLKWTLTAVTGGRTDFTFKRLQPVVAAATPSLPTPLPSRLNRFVPSGEERLIQFYTTLFIDCSQRGPTVGRISSMPRHGVLTLSQGDSFPSYNPNSVLARCNDKKVPGLVISYKSEDGYVGEDDASVLVIFADGGASQVDILFLVR
jgi:hypothetical protein